MKTSIIISLFFLVVVILFYFLFKAEDRSDTTYIKEAMMLERLDKRQTKFINIKSKRCMEDIYKEAEAYVDSLMQALGIEGDNGVDTVYRPYRPIIRPIDSLTLQDVPLQPLFEAFDSIEKAQ